MTKTQSLRGALWPILGLLMCVVAIAPVDAQGDISDTVQRDVLQTIQAQDRARIIVTLDVTDTDGLSTDGVTPFDTASATQDAARIQGAQNRVLAALSRNLTQGDLNSGDASGGLSAAQTANFQLNRRYQYIPALALTVDAAALNVLRRLPDVVAIEADAISAPTLSSSTWVIGAGGVGGAWEQGFTGTGWAVAILDTGVDIDHPFFNDENGISRLIAQACFNTTDATYQSFTRCPNGLDNDITSVDAGVDCESGDAVYCEHGSHVAGIAVGRDTGNGHQGVAPDAYLIAVNVHSYFDNTQWCASGNPCVLSFSSDQIAGLDYVLSLHHQGMKIASANLSLGGSTYHTTTCDDVEVSRKEAIDRLRSVGIATTISSGNNYKRDETSRPGCISSAITVSATDDNDLVASFSNVAAFVDVYAPGVSIVSSYPDDDYGTSQGTSMAAPHVAGAWALMRQAIPNASVDLIETQLETTGVMVFDQRSFGEHTLPRINLIDALDGFTFTAPDFDDDLLITPRDVMYVINRLNTSDAWADLDESGLVDSADVQAVLNLLGTTIGP